MSRDLVRKTRVATPLEDRSVECPRLGCSRQVSEHLECPYCFGGKTQVARGVRAEFCDWEEGQDPVAFGFPDWSQRRTG